MEVKLDKRWPLDVSLQQAWTVLSDVYATAACMPGAAITEQVDATHYKGTVRTRIGPAQMQFAGEIELKALDATTHSMHMLGKGADKSGSSASMDLAAHLEAGATPGSSVLVGTATVVVSGKLAQFGSRLLVPVSDAMLAQFAEHFRSAAAAVTASGVAQGSDVSSGSNGTGSTADPSADSAAATGASARRADTTASVSAPGTAPVTVRELNALALLWQVFKNWLAGLFGRKS